MRRIKSTSLILTVILFVTMLCGCSSRAESDDEIIATMKGIIEDRYDEEFEVVNFLRARDSTYTDILTLSNGEYQINVYHEPENVNYENIYDDYEMEIIDMKLKKLLFDKNIENVVYNACFMFNYSDEMSVESLKVSSGEEITDKYSLMKIICVINVQTPREGSPISEEEIFEIYSKAISFYPELLEFDVVYTDGESEEILSESVANIRAFYENDWTLYSDTLGYVSTTDMYILNPEDLFDGYKQKGLPGW